MHRWTAAWVAAVVSLSGIVACGPRQVDVRTAPAEATAVTLQVNNNLNQAVNVYTTVGGTDTFLRQVGANQTVTIPVPGVAAGSTVTLKAVTVDGVRTYTRQNVTMNGTFVFPLP
jgi:hypothetical protein